MKAVSLLINSELPPELRNDTRELDSRGLGDLMASIARNSPDDYARISKRLSDIGRQASYMQGETLTLGDMRPVIDKEPIFDSMRKELDMARKKSRTDEEYEEKRNQIWTAAVEDIRAATSKAALRKGNNLAYSVVSGARGKPAQLQAMLTTPGLYMDAQDNPVPLFIRNSFSEGLRPAEYLAGSYGARKSVLATKRATAKGGDLAKQMTQAAAGITISGKDCGTSNGLDYELDDDSLRGRLLANSAGGFEAGTPIDRNVLAELRKKKVKKVIARSPLTCSADHGLCSKCTGLDARGQFHPVGDAVGITATNAISEPITQGALNTKHTAGQASGKREYSGFAWINQFVQSPENFPDRAVLSEVEGTVSSVEEAPQGGTYVTVENEKHYVPHGFPVTSKVGDRVEAGTQLAEGLVDPSDIIRLQGLGEGRRYYADRLKQMLDDSGMKTDRRNTEILARASLDHIRIKDPDQDDPWLPDDVISYGDLSSRYAPPKDTKRTRLTDSRGKYLQRPILHYAIGDRVTRKMQDRLRGAGVSEVHTANVAPRFEAIMPRLRTASHANPDWLASMHTSYLKGQIGASAMRGRDTDVGSNQHFAPRIAIGQGFGDNVGEEGKF